MKTFQQFLDEAAWARIAARAFKSGRAVLKPGIKSGIKLPPLDIKMVGMPGSGKSTMARRLAQRTGGTATGYDDARQTIHGDRANQGNFPEVHALTMQRLKNAPKDKPRILDNTNVNPLFAQNTNNALRNDADFRNIQTVATDTSQRRSFARNANRETPVPDFVMNQMAAQERQFRNTTQGQDAITLGRELSKQFRLKRRSARVRLGIENPKRGQVYEQFLDEALRAQLIRAAINQFARNKALQQTARRTSNMMVSAGLRPTAEPVAAAARRIRLPKRVSGFQTARGSTYSYSRQPGSWPQTQRTAAVDPYHPTTPGVKQKSDWTLFTTPDDSMTMRQRFVSGGSDTPFYQGLRQSTQPRIGRVPVEVWKQYGEKAGRETIHPGSPITRLYTRPQGTQGGIGLSPEHLGDVRQAVRSQRQLQNPQIQATTTKVPSFTQPKAPPPPPSAAKQTLAPQPPRSSAPYRNLGAGTKETVRALVQPQPSSAPYRNVGVGRRETIHEPTPTPQPTQTPTTPQVKKKKKNGINPLYPLSAGVGFGVGYAAAEKEKQQGK